MKLDIDCIRDVLLYVEDKATFYNEISFTIDDVPAPLNKYDIDKLLYHIRYCKDSGLLEDCLLLEEEEIEIKDLTPLGHNFISNIKDDKNFNKLKAIMLKCGTQAIDVAVKLATESIYNNIFS